VAIFERIFDILGKKLGFLHFVVSAFIFHPVNTREYQTGNVPLCWVGVMDHSEGNERRYAMFLNLRQEQWQDDKSERKSISVSEHVAAPDALFAI
jgi:hypothetical protein